MAHDTSDPRQSPSSIHRKNLNLDQGNLDRVRDLLGAKSETDAVDQALSIGLLRQELVEGVERIAGTGGVKHVFEDDEGP